MGSAAALSGRHRDSQTEWHRPGVRQQAEGWLPQNTGGHWDTQARSAVRAWGLGAGKGEGEMRRVWVEDSMIPPGTPQIFKKIHTHDRVSYEMSDGARSMYSPNRDGTAEPGVKQGGQSAMCEAELEP